MTSFTTIDLEFGAAARQAWHPSEKRASSGPAPAPAPAPVDGSIARVHAMARVRLVHVRVLAAFTSTLMVTVLVPFVYPWLEGFHSSGPEPTT